jgi:hypothetical protein
MHTARFPILVLPKWPSHLVPTGLNGLYGLVCIFNRNVKGRGEVNTHLAYRAIWLCLSGNGQLAIQGSSSKFTMAFCLDTNLVGSETLFTTRRSHLFLQRTLKLFPSS